MTSTTKQKSAREIAEFYSSGDFELPTTILARSYLELENYRDFLAKEMTDRLSEITKLKEELEIIKKQRNDYRTFWMTVNTMHPWERTERLEQDEEELERLKNNSQ